MAACQGRGAPGAARRDGMSAAPHDGHHTGKGILLVMAAVMLFALMDAISKYLTRHYPVPFILWVRFLSFTLLVAATLGPRQGLGLVKTTRPGIQVLRGVLLPAASLFFVLGTRTLPIADASAITFVAPLLITMLAVWFLGERVGLRHWLAILAGFGGVLIIIRPGSSVFTWASMLPLAAAASTAVYQVLTRRVAGRESVYTSVFYPGLVGAAMFSLSLPWTWTPLGSPWHLGLMLLTGAISACSHLLLIKAYECAPASRLAPFSYSQMIWATAAGYFVFGTFPDWGTLLGIAVLAASGLYLATHLGRAGKAVAAD
jgi:drug/metabolite transporter (DMT)-like permease